MDSIDIKDHAPDPGLSQHDIDVIVGKAPPAVPITANPTEHRTSVLGTAKVRKVAVILETRPLSHLLPLLLHFSSVLGPEWPIYLFTAPSVVKLLGKSLSFKRAVDDGRIELRGLPMGVPEDYPFHDPLKRSEFLTQPWFWESLMPAEHVLLFSADSMICSKSQSSIDDFLKYDFIGAPLAAEDPDYDEILGVSGTLSLRNRNAMVNVARKTDWTMVASGNRDASGVFRKSLEDEWFWDKMTAAPILVKNKPWATLPNLETAKMFSMGDVWAHEPFGYDGALTKHNDRKVEILKWCPEYGISLLANVEERD